MIIIQTGYRTLKIDPKTPGQSKRHAQLYIGFYIQDLSRND